MKRASCQTRATLEQFYAELETADQDEISRRIGRAMRDLLAELRRDLQQKELARQRDAYINGTLIENAYGLVPLADLAAAAVGAARLFILASFTPESIVTVVFQAHTISAEAVHGQTTPWYSLPQRVIRSAADGRWEDITTEPFESGQALRSSATLAYGCVPDEFRSWDHFAALAHAAVSCATQVRDGIGYRHRVCHRGQLIDVRWSNPAKQDHPVQCRLIDAYDRLLEQVEH